MNIGMIKIKIKKRQKFMPIKHTKLDVYFKDKDEHQLSIIVILAYFLNQN